MPEEMPVADSVVVTGVGTVTPLGATPDEVLRRVEAGESAARPPSRFAAAPFSCPVCAEIPDFDPRRFVGESKALRLMNADAALAVAAARLAMRDARLAVDADYPGDETALYGATGLAGVPLLDVAPLVRYSADPNGRFDARRFGSVALKRVRPILSFRILSNMPISFVSIFEGLRGPNAVYNPWEGQGAHAIVAGIRAVERGEAACALVGGCDVKTHELAFVALEQQGVFRPWRSGGKGPVPGEGAAFLVLESQRRAEARGARIYARVAGYRLGTRPRDANGSAWYSSLVAPLVSPPPAAIVSAAEDGAPATDGTAARTTVKPKASAGNLFAAAAALQVALGAALAWRLGPGARILANCFGHGTEQAAFLLEAV